MKYEQIYHILDEAYNSDTGLADWFRIEIEEKFV